MSDDDRKFNKSQSQRVLGQMKTGKKVAALIRVVGASIQSMLSLRSYRVYIEPQLWLVSEVEFGEDGPAMSEQDRRRRIRRDRRG